MSPIDQNQALEECLDFIQSEPHGRCRHFKLWHCGQHGLLDKYRPNWRDGIAIEERPMLEPVSLSSWQKITATMICGALCVALILLALNVRVEPAACVPLIKAPTTEYKVRPPGWHMP